jgi:hypothetical protein
MKSSSASVALDLTVCRYDIFIRPVAMGTGLAPVLKCLAQRVNPQSVSGLFTGFAGIWMDLSNKEEEFDDANPAAGIIRLFI